MALHSRFRAIRSNRSKRATLPTATPDNRQWEVDMGNGFVRVDNGAPPPRLPSESQPVSVGALEAPALGLPVPVVTIETLPTPALTIRTPLTTNWQREFGLGKQD
jgi:hypothetical protein